MSNGNIIQYAFGWLLITVLIGWGYYSFRFLYFDEVVQLKITKVEPELHVRNKITEYDWLVTFDKDGANSKNLPVTLNLNTTSKLEPENPPYNVGERLFFLRDASFDTYKFIGNNDTWSKLLHNLSSIPFTLALFVSALVFAFHNVNALITLLRKVFRKIRFSSTVNYKLILSTTSICTDFVFKASLLIIIQILWILTVNVLITIPNLSPFILGPLISGFFIISISPIPTYLIDYEKNLPILNEVITTIQNIAFLAGLILMFRLAVSKIISLNDYDTIISFLVDFLLNILKHLLDIPD